MRDRLIEMLDNAKAEIIECYPDGTPCMSYTKKAVDRRVIYQLANYLLSNGVIVPPCKVGDKLYEIDLPEYGIIICEATKVLYDSRNVVVNVIDGHGKGSEYYFDFDDFGKTVFLTKEEAEEALKGGAE